MTEDILKFIKSKRFSRQFAYSFIPVICFESADNCYLNNPLKEKLGLKKYASFIVIWKNKDE